MFENGLFIFRRDFRIVDNHGLSLVNSKCKNVYTIFIFTPEQVGQTNEFKSNNAVQFMIESLDDLSKKIHAQGGQLHFFYGSNNKIISECIHALKIDYICFNRDYTPYAVERDADIMNICKKQNVECETVGDYYLHEPGEIMSGGGTPYKKFTPYYHTSLHKKIPLPTSAHKIKFKTIDTHKLLNTISLTTAHSRFTKDNQNILVHEVYKAFRTNHQLVRQLIWRDFYMNILYFFPYVLGKPMKPNYSKIRWHKNTKWFNAWMQGKTGFPIVDAGMRELNTTGYMHNRARLIVASFLVKTLLIDWREGEKYFAKKLTDYDPASNNGNWQWIASSGADSQPYFRIFNPWLQSNEVDPDAEYIKKWIPELKDVSPKDIHSWETTFQNYKSIGYEKPICSYEEQKEKALAMFRAIY